MPCENRWLRLLVFVSLAAFAVGCTSGGGGGNVPNSAVFWSGRALDGSDAANTNDTFNIGTVNLDGTGAKALTKLTALNADSSEPIPSPHGSQFAFESSRALDGSDAANTNGFRNVWVVKSDGTAATPLTKLTKAGSFEPLWSPDGTKIVFESQGALDGSDNANTNFTTNIWVVNADGSSPTPLTKLTAAGARSFLPSWSPDGTKIVFESERALDGSDAQNAPNGTLNIWTMKADGSSPTPLTKLTASGANSFLPFWSPDGTKIVFESQRALDGSDNANTNFTRNIWVMNADGTSATALTKLTASGAGSFDPAWSRDGTKIVFDSTRALDGSDASNAAFNIWIMNADGSTQTPLTKLTATNADSFGPVLFVTGGKIVFESGRALDGTNAANNPNDTFNIWIMNADGTSQTPLSKLTAAGADSFVRLG